MKRKILFSFAGLPLLLLFACGPAYKNETQLALDSSEKFYKNFDAGNFREISETQIEMTRENLRKFKLSEKLKIITDAFGGIDSKNLKNTEAKAFDKNSAIVSCDYEINAKSGRHYQKLIWLVSEEEAKLSDVLTYSYNDKGEMQLMVVDGKIIL